MPLTDEVLAQQKAHFWSRTAYYASLGYDRLAAAAFVLDEAGPLDGPVLDVGTGMGITARALATRSLDVVTVDTNAHDQEVAAFLTDQPEHARRIRFMVTSAAALPFPDGHFGAAVAVDVLHHLEEGRPALAELARVVRPGGAVVLADFSREGFEMVARVHESEGRVHPEGPVTMDWARGFLCGGLGLTEEKASTGQLHRVSVLRVPAAGRISPAFASLDRAGLLRSLEVFASNWLAHDGCWFLAAEERFGMEAAIDLDAASWRRFAAAEARRIMSAFAIPPGGGLESLRRALAYRMYSFINPWRTEISADGDAPEVLHGVLPRAGHPPSQIAFPTSRASAWARSNSKRSPARWTPHPDYMPALPSRSGGRWPLRVGVPPRRRRPTPGAAEQEHR